MLRPQGAGRRQRVIGSGSIITGLVLLAIGVYCVTTLNGPSFDVNTFAGAQPTARDYLLLVIEIAVTGAGAYSLFYGIVSLRKGRKQLTFSRSMHFVDADYVSDPKLSRADRCWQCGAKVRARNAICYRCGATQQRGAAFRGSLQPGALPEAGSFPPPNVSGPLSPHVAPPYSAGVSPYPPTTSAPSHPQPHPNETEAQGDWPMHGELPEDGDAAPRSFYPWR